MEIVSKEITSSNSREELSKRCKAFYRDLALRQQWLDHNGRLADTKLKRLTGTMMDPSCTPTLETGDQAFLGSCALFHVSKFPSAGTEWLGPPPDNSILRREWQWYWNPVDHDLSTDICCLDVCGDW